MSENPLQFETGEEDVTVHKHGVQVWIAFFFSGYVVAEEDDGVGGFDAALVEVGFALGGAFDEKDVAGVRWD